MGWGGVPVGLCYHGLLMMSPAQHGITHIRDNMPSFTYSGRKWRRVMFMVTSGYELIDQTLYLYTKLHRMLLDATQLIGLLLSYQNPYKLKPTLVVIHLKSPHPLLCWRIKEFLLIHVG